MFNKIFIENDLKNISKVNEITTFFKNSEVVYIDSYDDYFSKIKKPYLQKRDNLNLFLAQKKGNLVKLAPDAYGLSGEPHYYFIHAYNCIYECNYCYLQGYFNSPDIVFFLNHNEIGDEIKKIASIEKNKRTWFHAGEYSDSLALSHISGELPFYFELFKDLPHSILELRTKSANIKELLKLKPLSNIIISFSLSPKHRAKVNDFKTPPLSTRLKAMRELHLHGYKVAIHLDPMIYDQNFESSYNELIFEINEHVELSKIEYCSLGVVRFTKDVFHQVKKNYPESDILAQDFINSFDNKVRYNKPMRMWMLNKTKDMLLKNGMKDESIYLCMEN